MEAKEIKIIKLKCKKCGYEFIPRVKNPIKCPHCQTQLSKNNPKILIV